MAGGDYYLLWRLSYHTNRIGEMIISKHFLRDPAAMPEPIYRGDLY